MAVISMKQLLEAGVHFGHQTRRWNPKMAPYIYTERNGIYIIDLQKTVRKIDEAYMFVRDLALEGKSILFVGTKKQAQESVEQEAKRCGMFYVNNRWLGGMLTNFRTIKTRIARLNAIDKMEADGQFEVLPKKEVAKLTLEREKLENNLGGIREMKNLPARCSSSTRARSASPCRKPARCTSRSWPSSTPTATPMRSTTSSRQRRRHPRRQAHRRQDGRRRARGAPGRAERGGRSR